MIVAVAVAIAVGWRYAYAHPEEEFCGEGGLDPLLCAELTQLDSAGDATSAVLPRVDPARSPLATLALYTELGIRHILPAGADHLLFILALLLSTQVLTSLLLQISLFTLAHTTTLALSALGYLPFFGVWVEVLIAVSIAVVGGENIFLREVRSRRSLLVFCFGLLHGLGFAGALADLGMQGEHFVSALAGFNIGVELGQLGFALAVFAALYPAMRQPWYRRAIVMPISIGITMVGIWWALERSGLI